MIDSTHNLYVNLLGLATVNHRIKMSHLQLYNYRKHLVKAIHSCDVYYMTRDHLTVDRLFFASSKVPLDSSLVSRVFLKRDQNSLREQNMGKKK